MDSRALGKVQAVVAVLGVLAASVGGAVALGLVGAPGVVAVENRFGEVTNETTVVHTDLVVNNPNPIGVTLGDTTVDYTVRMNNVSMAQGSKRGLRISPGNTTMEFTTQMDNQKIPAWWVSHIRNGERTDVVIDAQVKTSILGNRTVELEEDKQVQTNIIGAFASNETRPVNGPETILLSNPLLYVNRTDATWGSVTDAETPIVTRFDVYNPKASPIVITEIGYDITMNDIRVGQGASDRSYVIPSGTTKTVQARTAIQNAKLDAWWVSHLRNDQVTDLRIDFYAKIKLPTGQVVEVPLRELTYTTTIETDMFGTKNESASAGATGATPTGTDGGTTERETTPSDDGTAAHSGTPTTDGLLGRATRPLAGRS